MPFPERDRFHLEAVVRLTPNLRATWDCESPVCRSCAANRRLLSISSRVRLPNAAVSICLARLIEFQSDTRISENIFSANCFFRRPFETPNVPLTSEGDVRPGNSRYPRPEY